MSYYLYFPLFPCIDNKAVPTIKRFPRKFNLLYKRPLPSFNKKQSWKISWLCMNI